MPSTSKNHYTYIFLSSSCQKHQKTASIWLENNHVYQKINQDFEMY